MNGKRKIKPIILAAIIMFLLSGGAYAQVSISTFVTTWPEQGLRNNFNSYNYQNLNIDNNIDFTTDMGVAYRMLGQNKTINGNDHYFDGGISTKYVGLAVEANNMSRTLSINSLTLQNLTSAISLIDEQNNNTVVLNLNKVNFIDNLGSAIFTKIAGNSSTSIRITAGGTMGFYGNSASQGGAMYLVNKSTVSFTDSTTTFSSNTATSGGGAIFISGANSNLHFLRGTINFTSNTAVGSSGGALYTDTDARVTFSNADTTFFNNRVNYIANGIGGGAIYSGGGLLTFSGGDVKFTSNSVITNGTSSGGGAIYSTGSGVVSFENVNSFFLYNKAEGGRGGAIYANSNVSFSTGSASFTGNSASNGGAIYVNSAVSFSSNSASFIRNSADSGGAIYVNTTALSFNNGLLSFTGNSANNGGALYAGSGSISVNNGTTVTFSSNTADGMGGAIFTANTVGFTNTDKVIFSNNSAYQGGAIMVMGGGVNFSSINTLEFNYSTASIGGAAYVMGSAFLNFNNIGSLKFSGNSSDTDGGALFLSSGGNLTITDSVLTAERNEAKNGAGGFMYLSGQSITFSKAASFLYNTAKSSGGAVYSAGASPSNYAFLTFSGTTNSNYNKALNGIGGAFFSAYTRFLFSGESAFTGNEAKEGGAFYMTSSSASFTGKTTFDANKALSGNGGAFYLYSSTLTFANNTVDFKTNQANGGSGGGIYAKSSIIQFANVAATFLNNYALNGGALFADSNSKVNFNNGTSKFQGNTGSAIFAQEALLSFANNNATFSGNSTVNSGGAISANKSSTILFSSGTTVFSGNTANNNGGAVYIGPGSYIHFSNARFEDNYAGQNGGAVYIEGNSSYSASAVFRTSVIGTSSQTVFTGNRTASTNNSLHIGNYSTVTFLADANTSVHIYDGISGGSINAVLNYTGPGTFNFYGYGMNNYSDINSNGTFNLRNGAYLRAGKFTNANNSALNMDDGKRNELHVADFVNGNNNKLIMEIAHIDSESDSSSDQIFVNGTLNLGTNSTIEIKMLTDRFKRKTFKLINYNNRVGTFANEIYDARALLGEPELDYGTLIPNWITLTLYGKGVDTNFSAIEGLTKNQTSVAYVYDILSANSAEYLDLDNIITLIDSFDEPDIKKALTQASGYFIANVIRSGGINTDSNYVYDRIRNNNGYDATNSGLWAQGKVNAVTIKGDEESPEDYTDNAAGAMIGYDRYIDRSNILFGVYLKINKHDIKQGSDNTADITNTGIGVYGGYIQDMWEIKGLISGGMDTYNTERSIPFAADNRRAKADFSGMTIGADIEGALKIALTGVLKLRPYVGFETRSSSYDDIKEAGASSLNLNVTADSYQRSAARFGLGVVEENEKYSWYAGGEYKQVLNGTRPEIEDTFEGTNQKFKIVGAEEGAGAVGAKIGGSLNVMENLELYANANYFIADSYNNMYGNIGVRWIFLGSERVEKDARESEADYYDKEMRKEEKRIEKEAEKLRKEQAKAMQLQYKTQLKEDEAKRKQLQSEMAVSEADSAKNKKDIDSETRRQIEDTARIKKEDAERAAREAKALEDERNRELKRIEKEEERIRKEEERFAKYQEKERKAAERAQTAEAAKAAEAEKQKLAQAKLAEKLKMEQEIAEYEAMLAAEKAGTKKAASPEIKKEIKEQTVTTASAKQKTPAVSEAQNAAVVKKPGAEISDAELEKKKKESESRMFKPILKSFEVRFMSNKSELTDYWKIEIQKQITDIKRYNYKKIIIEGHCDSSEKEGKKLSRLRAKAVYDEFINSGIPADKVEYVGLSSIMPAASNDTEAGKMASRRVVVVAE